mgnify:CR=1 FL=1
MILRSTAGAIGLVLGMALAVAGIYLSDIPALRYEKHLFYEKVLRSVTANTRADGQAFLDHAGEFLAERDVWLTPTAATPPFPVEQPHVTEINGRPVGKAMQRSPGMRGGRCHDDNQEHRRTVSLTCFRFRVSRRAGGSAGRPA